MSARKRRRAPAKPKRTPAEIEKLRAEVEKEDATKHAAFVEKRMRYAAGYEEYADDPLSVLLHDLRDSIEMLRAAMNSPEGPLEATLDSFLWGLTRKSEVAVELSKAHAGTP